MEKKEEKSWKERGEGPKNGMLQKTDCDNNGWKWGGGRREEPKNTGSQDHFNLLSSDLKYRVTMVVGDYIVLTLILKLFRLSHLLCHDCPIHTILRKIGQTVEQLK